MVSAPAIVFAGPSLAPVDIAGAPEIDFRPPVGRGDILRVIDRKPRAIGIIDGVFGDRPSVLHKELIEAMSCMIPVFGAASMGALRAAELSAFGMVGIGRVYRQYADGTLIADSAVAVIHGPAELGFPALSVAEVDVVATVDALVQRGKLSQPVGAAIRSTAARIHFAQRTWRRIAEELPEMDPEAIFALLSRSHVEAKRNDALALLKAIREPLKPGIRPPPAPRSPSFRRLLERLQVRA